MADLETAIHDYMDDLEDLQVDAAAELTAIVEGLVAGERVTIAGETIQLADRQALDAFLLSLGREEVIDSLADRLALHIAPRLFVDAQQVAVSQAERLVEGTAVASAVRQLAEDVRSGSRSLLSQDVATRQTAVVGSTIRRALREPSERIRDALTQARAAQGSTEAAARRVVDQLRQDLEEGGPVFGRLTSGRAFDGPARQGAGLVADQATGVALAAPTSGDADPTDQQFRWVAALVNTCPWCLSRHGQVATYGQWAIRGLPQTSWGNPCEAHCQCRLVPAFAQLPSGAIPGHAEVTEDLRRASEELVERTADGGLGRSRTIEVDGETIRIPRGRTIRVPSQLAERERLGSDIRINAETGEVIDRRRDRILRQAEDSIEVRRGLRVLGQLNARRQ